MELGTFIPRIKTMCHVKKIMTSQRPRSLKFNFEIPSGSYVCCLYTDLVDTWHGCSPHQAKCVACKNHALGSKVNPKVKPKDFF